MKKYELRELCMKRNIPGSGTVKALIQRLEENDVSKEHIDYEVRCPEKYCESCEDNPSRLYKPPPVKCFCQEYDQHICEMCKSAQIMREWIRIEFEMDKLESDNTSNDLRF